MRPSSRDIRLCPGSAPLRTVAIEAHGIGVDMRLSRRRLLSTVAAIPVILLIDRGARIAGDGVGAAVAALRPPTQGTSASRCALCGSPEHAMLDPRCPAARPVI